MSMLAGPRRKQKWTLNPRGKQWSEDTGKYGQKILEKMGWSSGKGLGAQEQGMVEHIRVKVKNDQVGIGFDKNRDDHWTEHQDNFNDLLKNLQGQTDMADEAVEEQEKVLSGKSLEEKSKLSQKRVHYKKFTRGKDVNKYSMKDLANIFGKKDLNEKTLEKVTEEQGEIIYDPVGTQDTTAGILTIKGGSINDYFKKRFKMAEQPQPLEQEESSDFESKRRIGFGYEEKSRSKFYVDDITSSIKGNSDNESEKRFGFGFEKSSKSKFYITDGACTKDDTSKPEVEKSPVLPKKNSKKSKSRKSDDLNYVFDNPCLDLDILDSPQPLRIEKESRHNQITPKKRTCEFVYENEGLDVECLDAEPVAKKRKSDSLGLEPQFSDSSISTSKKLKDNTNQQLRISESYLPELEVQRKSTPKKSKRKKKNESNGLENLGMDTDLCEDATSYEVRRDNLDEIHLNTYENPGLELEDLDEIPLKSSKIGYTPDTLSSAYINPALALDLEYSTGEKRDNDTIVSTLANSYENPAFNVNSIDISNDRKSRKKKKLKTNTEEDTNLPKNCGLIRRVPSENDLSLKYGSSHQEENSICEQEFTDKTTPKKTKKNKRLSSGLENPAMDLDILEHDSKVSMNFEVVRLNSGLENIALNISDEDTRKKRVTFNDEIQYNTDVVKKKKKKKKKLDKYEVVNSKLKKTPASTEPVTFVNEALDIQVLNEEQIDNELNEIKSKKSRRKKVRRLSVLETIEEAPEEEEITIIETREKNLENNIQIVAEVNRKDEDETPASSSQTKHKKEKRKNTSTKHAGNSQSEEKNVEEIDITEEVAANKKKRKNQSDQNCVKNDETYSQLCSSEKENDCGAEKVGKISHKKKGKKKSSSRDDIISLEEFLNEESSLRTKMKKTKSLGGCEVESFQSKKKDSKRIENDISQNSSQKHQKPKDVMKSLFIKNPTLMFNGSNINEITGYGSQIRNSFH
ncbi:hypothetical protein QAD02_006768 [Eretmocerus hayati]|uniref:Uncharacterized protein n=1 Tax=Eretmocerus hayati TaxID=131215 RepID=A0ACC2N253_9HYME|nr:hypothetical protein QAD02_006768 [Eretmocerus hayati]